jgi:hypothetical protein
MKIEHFILANSSSIDHERNTLSVWDFMEDVEVRTNTLGIVFPIHAILVLKRDRNEVGELPFNGKIEIMDPTGKEIVTHELSAKMDPKHRRLRVKMNLGVPVSKSGFYTFRISGLDSKPMAAETDINITVHVDRPAVSRGQDEGNRI